MAEHPGEILGAEEARRAGDLGAAGVVEDHRGNGTGGDPLGNTGVVIDVHPGETHTLGQAGAFTCRRFECGHEPPTWTAPRGPQVHRHPPANDGVLEGVVGEVDNGMVLGVFVGHPADNAPAVDVVPDTVASVLIEVYSDVVCPWCFLAARRLRRALGRIADATPPSGGGSWVTGVTVRWRAFQLDGGARQGTDTLRDVLERKYGPGAFDAMTARFATLGPPEGIDYRFDLAARAPTTDAHRLLAWAWSDAGAATQGALADALFSAYFEQGADIADHDTLTRLAASVDLDGHLAAEVLASGAFSDEVAADLAEAAALDIHAVPTMVVAGGIAIPGAQDVDTLAGMLTRLHERSS